MREQVCVRTSLEDLPPKFPMDESMDLHCTNPHMQIYFVFIAASVAAHTENQTFLPIYLVGDTIQNNLSSVYLARRTYPP